MGNFEHYNEGDEKPDKVKLSKEVTDRLVKPRKMAHKPAGPAGPPPPGAIDDLFEEDPKKPQEEVPKKVEPTAKPKEADPKNLAMRREIAKRIKEMPDYEARALTPKNYNKYMRGNSLLMYSASWCKPCKAVKPMMAAIENLSGGKVKTVYFNGDEPYVPKGQKITEMHERRHERFRDKVNKRIGYWPQSYPMLITVIKGEKHLYKHVRDDSPFEMLRVAKEKLGIDVDIDPKALADITLKYSPIMLFAHLNKLPEDVREAYKAEALARAVKMEGKYLFWRIALKADFRALFSREEILDAARKGARAINHTSDHEFINEKWGMELLEIAAEADPRGFLHYWYGYKSKDLGFIRSYRRKDLTPEQDKIIEALIQKAKEKVKEKK